MKIEYKLILNSHIRENHKELFAALLKEQGKVQGNLKQKADRCKIICFARKHDTLIAIGAIKRKTKSDFLPDKANLPELSDRFEWELGYLYTKPDYQGRGIASNVVTLLIDSYGPGNLMASTEISANPAMVKILEKNGFRHYGKPWKSQIHGNDLGLFLKFQ